MVFILSQGRDARCWSHSPACTCVVVVTVIVSYFEKSLFLKKEESTVAIQVPGSTGLFSLHVFGGTHPKEKSSIAKSFPSAG